MKDIVLARATSPGEIIKKLRKLYCFTQKGFAEKVSIPLRTLQRYENDETLITTEALKKIGKHITDEEKAELYSAYLVYQRDKIVKHAMKEKEEKLLGEHLAINDFVSTIDELTVDEQKKRADKVYKSLNFNGREKWIDNGNDLAKVPEYQKEKEDTKKKD